MADLKGVRQPFKEQLLALEKRLQNRVPTRSWDDLKANAHDRAFVIASAMKADLLADFAEAIGKAISQGQSIEAFRSNFDGIVKKHGWQYNGERNWRTRVIYRTNMLTSYASGRLAQLNHPDLVEIAPYWMYHHGGSADPRPHHLAWDKITLHRDDPFWQKAYPPNGWGCSCYVTAHSKAQAERLGGRFESPKIEDGDIDEGWDYQPGASIKDELVKLAGDKTIKLPPELGASFWQSNDQILSRASVEFKQWFETVMDDDYLMKKDRRVVGVLSSELIQSLTALGVKPLSSALVITDDRLRHALRPNKKAPVDRAFMADLPARLVKEAEAIMLDRSQSKGDKEATLLFVYPNVGDDKTKLVVDVNYQLKGRGKDGKRAVDKVNLINTATVVDHRNLKSADYTVIKGEISEGGN